MRYQKYLDGINLVSLQEPPKGGRKIKTFAAEWEERIGILLKPSTLRGAKSHLRIHILPRIGDLPLTACTVKNVQAFISAMAVAGLSRKTIENILTTLHSLLSTALKWSYIPAVALFKRGDLYLPRENERKEARFFEAAQAKRIIAASTEPHATIYAVLACTGIRAGECLGLKVTDIDFDKGVIKIRRTLDHATRKTHAPKSKSSSADLPLPSTLASRLREYLSNHWKDNPQRLLFANSKGKPMQRDKIVYRLKATLRQLGIEKAGLHAFRTWSRPNFSDPKPPRLLFNAKCDILTHGSRFRHIRI